MTISRKFISIKGIVQGVGFRPFVYRQAKNYSLKGVVTNTSAGVEIDVEGEEKNIDCFVESIKRERPPGAKVDSVYVTDREIIGYGQFVIGESVDSPFADTLVSVDIAICEDCLKELLDPGDRRKGYPFINCTNCGPRFTIIRDIPYDRENTTMKIFPMCPECLAEYSNPDNRRFHAQPNACHVCGPKVELRDSSGGLFNTDHPVKDAACLLRDGNILAVKGLGGYHLSCNALDNNAVSILRQRKIREDKPFAVMARDIEQASLYCHINDTEAGLLSSSSRPIVLLKKREASLAEQAAPGNSYLGVMLPYTPLHYLIFEQIDFPLVMTSGNLSDEPIAYEDKDAMMRLGQIADYFLLHNREICHRCDDSVIRVYRDEQYPLRRARGYTPGPVRLKRDAGQVLAVGGEQKNTFCLTKGKYAFVSHHIGDLENLETLQAFEREIEMYKKLFNVVPDIVAYDYHPDYLSTKYAMELKGIQNIGVQHHHAHIASCMAEYGLEGNVLGVAFDGTGFGPDGSIWGGEFLYCSYAGFQRIGYLKHRPMPGGSRAIKEPWRMASGYLYDIFGKDWKNQKKIKFLGEKNGMLIDALEEMMKKWINCPPTSSMGRFFDAVSAMIGIRGSVNYEGQAAVEMEQLAITAGRPRTGIYHYSLEESGSTWEVNTDQIIKGVLDDIPGYSQSFISYKFHLTVKDIVINVCLNAREKFGENRVCLSGGVFQNMLLLDMVHTDLEKKGFEVYVHRLVPANDGGISLGQAVIAAERRKEGCV